MPEVDPYRNYNFKLEIQGVTEGHFTECNGMGVKVDSIAYREGGASQVVRRLPGPVDYGDITLRYGLTSSTELWDWFLTSVKGTVERKNVSIVMLDADGSTKVVRWNLLYRSNNLADLTADDLRYLTRLGVKLVCDFRSEVEREREPNRPPEAASTEELTIQVEGVDPNAMQERIRTGVRANQLELIMLNAYRSFVTHHSDQFATMFDRILHEDNLPTIVHCTAGKDRTGFASAMILSALGVPEKTVYEDYMATNRYRASYNRWISRLVPIYSLFRTRSEDLDPLLAARRPYLEASYDTIEAHYGSVDNYLETRLGVSPDEREQLRQIFLR